jgi:hypothetical protein
MTNGLVVMTPTSISYTGTSASINADGSVDFSAVSNITLNGIFTSDYDNYMLTARLTSTNNQSVTAQLTLAGTPANSGYAIQWIAAQGTTVSANRVTSSSATYIGSIATIPGGLSCYFFGPFLAQPTAIRNVEIFGQNSAEMFDFASTHSTATSYDGLKMQTGTGTMTGLLTVFGFNQ